VIATSNENDSAEDMEETGLGLGDMATGSTLLGASTMDMLRDLKAKSAAAPKRESNGAELAIENDVAEDSPDASPQPLPIMSVEEAAQEAIDAIDMSGW
jgi:hypothetical protein